MIRTRGWWLWPATVAALFAYFVTIQFRATSLAGVDVFYHMKLALLMREQGFLREFPWMQFAVLKDHWVDQHFLFHVLLIPFTFGDLIVGARLAAATFAALALTSFTIFLRRRGVAFPFLWLLLLLGSSSAFLYRINMVRAQTVATILFLLFLDALLERRPRVALAVGFAFVWTYQLFLLLVPLMVIVVVADLLQRRRPDWQTAAGGLLGIFGGLVINPFFPHNLVFLYQHAVVKVLNRAGIGVGAEWGPFDSWFVLAGNWPVYLVLGAAFLGLLLRPGPVGRTPLVLTLVAGLFFFMQMRSRRFIEYWPTFALAGAATLMMERFAWQRWRRARMPALVVIACVAALLAGRNHRRAVRELDANLPPDRYRGGAEWLAVHSIPGETIFTTDWDDFAELFFHNHSNHYLVGLDPTFMLLHDRTLFYEWDQIAGGRLGMAAASIQRDFGARFVFTDQAHRDFMRMAADDPAFFQVYADDECAVYQIRGAGTVDRWRIEGETRYPPRRAAGGTTRIQNLHEEFGVTCSNNRLLFFRGLGPGAHFEFEIRVTRLGRYDLAVGLVMAGDYGIVQFSVDGEAVGFPFDAYSEVVGTAERIAIGDVLLTPGAHTVRVTVTGKQPQSTGHYAGLDYIELERRPAP